MYAINDPAEFDSLVDAPHEETLQSIILRNVQEVVNAARPLWYGIEDELTRKLTLTALCRETKNIVQYSDLVALLRQEEDGHVPIQIVDGLEFIEQDLSGIEWAIAGLLPMASSSILYADGGCGKTLLIYHLARCILSGQRWNGYRVKKGKVLIVQTDEPNRLTLSRLRKANFRQYVATGDLALNFDWQFTQPKKLAAFVEKYKPNYVIIDSLSSSNKEGLERENDPVYANGLRDLTSIANDNNCHIMTLHHSNKAGNYRGTTAIRDAVCEAFEFRKLTSKEIEKKGWDEKTGDRMRILYSKKSRTGIDTKFYLELQKADYTWKYHKDALDSESPLDARLLQWFEVNPDRDMKASDLTHYFNESIRDIFIELQQLVEKGLLVSKENFCNGKRDDLFYNPGDDETARLLEVRAMMATIETMEDVRRCQEMTTKDERSIVYLGMTKQERTRLKDLFDKLKANEGNKVVQFPVKAPIVEQPVLLEQDEEIVENADYF